LVYEPTQAAVVARPPTTGRLCRPAVADEP